MRGKRFLRLPKVRSRGASNPIERRRFPSELPQSRWDRGFVFNAVLERNKFKAAFIFPKAFGKDKDPPRIKKYSQK
ncbi:MAG: hypothetical protein IKZ82_00555 [Clostridia bacterium]|nr:hypothetical protein [Clostridia bacterium]